MGLGKFCDACQGIPKHGYCSLPGCPLDPAENGVDDDTGSEHSEHRDTNKNLPPPTQEVASPQDGLREKIARIIDPEALNLPRINLYRAQIEGAFTKSDAILALLPHPPGSGGHAELTNPEPDKALVERAWQDLLDKDDRTSPEDYPEMCLITKDELADILALHRLQPQQGPQAEGGA